MPTNRHFPLSTKVYKANQACTCVAERSPLACEGATGVAGGALDALELDNESSDGGGGVATALSRRRRSALSESLCRGGGGGGRDATVP
eukprot:scaffold39553_cov63-Phaeocystis_antarctica.AAC.3